MKFIIVCLFTGLFLSCAHRQKGLSPTTENKIERPSEDKTKKTGKAPSNGGLDL